MQDSLPIQAGHFDVTDDNVLRADGAVVPDAVIDFGDVCSPGGRRDRHDLSSVLHHDGASPETALPAIRASKTASASSANDEITALWPLVILRGAVLVLSGRAQVRLDDENAYATDGLDREFRILVQAASVPIP